MFSRQGEVFPSEGKMFLIQGEMFLVHGKMFLVQEKVFLVQGKVFLVQQKVFLVQEKVFWLREKVFLVEERLCLVLPVLLTKISYLRPELRKVMASVGGEGSMLNEVQRTGVMSALRASLVLGGTLARPDLRSYSNGGPSGLKWTRNIDSLIRRLAPTFGGKVAAQAFCASCC